MGNELLPNSINKKFEEYMKILPYHKKMDSGEVDYWEVRELMLLLGYDEWRNFKKVIFKAQEACKNSRQAIKNHFVDVDNIFCFI